MSGQESFHNVTRAVYEKQHSRIAADDTTFNRVYNIYENAEFGIPPEWWPGRLAADLGCGNFGAFFLWLINRGVKEVHGMDLGESWMPIMRESLSSRGADLTKVILKSGNVLQVPYADQSFDFVAINGVLVHLDTMEEVRKGFAEGARCTKDGGYFFTSYGPCRGALMEAVFPALQSYYRANEQFRQFIDSIRPSVIHGAIDLIVDEHGKRTNEALDGSFLKALFGEDFCVFLQNYIQRPTDFSNDCTPEVVETMYREHGFTKIVRMNHFVKRTDIRKFLAPLHYHWDHPVAQSLYGEGFVQYLGQK